MGTAAAALSWSVAKLLAVASVRRRWRSSRSRSSSESCCGPSATNAGASAHHAPRQHTDAHVTRVKCLTGAGIGLRARKAVAVADFSVNVLAPHPSRQTALVPGAGQQHCACLARQHRASDPQALPALPEGAEVAVLSVLRLTQRAARTAPPPLRPQVAQVAPEGQRPCAGALVLFSYT